MEDKSLTKEEKRVVEAMNEDDTLSFKGLSKKAGVGQDRLVQILDGLMERDLLKGKEATKTMRIENDKQIAIIEIFEKSV